MAVDSIGSARLGSARLGSARLGSARLGSARLGSALFISLVALACSEDESDDGLVQADGRALSDTDATASTEDGGSLGVPGGTELADGELDEPPPLELEIADAELEKPSKDAVLLFESVRKFEGGEPVMESIVGELSPADQLRSARPYRHLHEAWVLEEQTWTREEANGEVEHGLRIWLKPNPQPAADPMTLEDQLPGAPNVGPDVIALLETEWKEDERHFVTVTLRGYPEWDVPLRPREDSMGLEAAAAQQAARDARLEERKQLFDQAVAPLVDLVEATGGKLVLPSKTSGWAMFQVSQKGLEGLVERNDLRSISLEDGLAESGWPLGTGRQDARVDAGDYVDSGYDGGGPSGGSAVAIAFIEGGTFEAGACGFYAGANCTGTSRILKKYDCNATTPDVGNDFCKLVTAPTLPQYPDFEDPPPSQGITGNHGTMVVSVAIADYTLNQGEGHLLGDTTTSHSSTWEINASGYAPRAKALYYGNMFQDAENLTIGRTPRHAEAFGLAVTDGADIISFSQGTGAQRCEPQADLSSELAAEDAFDDGVLIAACTGNHASGESTCETTCGTWSVGSLAKTLAIAGFRSQDSACTSNFADCRKDYCQQYVLGACWDDYSACRGGADVKVDGSTYTGAASLTDLLMPTHVSSATRYDQNLNGAGKGVVNTGTSGGCSAATPQLAGLAASLKDFHLSSGHTWIDNPGRLHSVLLLQGDRSFAADGPSSTISKKNAGTDPLWGVGRVRARLWGSASLSPSLLTTYTKSYTQSSSAETFRPFVTTAPLPTGVDLVKCALLQIEDFSGENLPVTISDVNLSLRVRDPVSGSCSAGTGTLRYTRSDNSQDWKKMAAIQSTQTTLAGKCVYVTLDPVWVEAQGVSTVLSCSYSGLLESEG